MIACRPIPARSSRCSATGSRSINGICKLCWSPFIKSTSVCKALTATFVGPVWNGILGISNIKYVDAYVHPSSHPKVERIE